MPSFFYGNFDFEETLAAPGRRRSRRVERILAELAPSWLAVADPGDLIWCPQPIEPAFFDRLSAAGLPCVSGISEIEQVPTDFQLIPWGWTPEIVEIAERRGMQADLPPLEAVRSVNSRQFAFDQEQAHGVAQAGGGVASEWSELFELLEHSAAERWIIKSEFSQAGRDRFLFDPAETGSAGTLKAWSKTRLRSGSRLFLEPWLEAVAEAGIQLTIERDGAVEVEGIVGTGYRGGALAAGDFSLGHDEAVRWREAVRIAALVAQAAAGTGYFGPLGVDAMWYRDADGSLKLRVIQDVNARWTMGRVCLGHRRLLHPGERGRWLLGPAVADIEEDGKVPGRRILQTSPEVIADLPVRLRTAVVIDRAEQSAILLD